MVRRRSAGSTGSANTSGNKPENKPESKPESKPEAPSQESVELEEAIVLDLKATLDAVQPKDTVLLKQISDLKADLEAKSADLEAKNNLIAKLQTELQTLQTEAKQSDQLKTELAEAKQMILKLSEVNAKPLAAVPPTPAPKPEPKPALHIEPAPRRSQHETALRKVLQHPTPPGSLPSMPSEKKEGQISELDIGWMD